MVFTVSHSGQRIAVLEYFSIFKHVYWPSLLMSSPIVDNDNAKKNDEMTFGFLRSNRGGIKELYFMLQKYVVR